MIEVGPAGRLSRSASFAAPSFPLAPPPSRVPASGPPIFLTAHSRILFPSFPCAIFLQSMIHYGSPHGLSPADEEAPVDSTFSRAAGNRRAPNLSSAAGLGAAGSTDRRPTSSRPDRPSPHGSAAPGSWFGWRSEAAAGGRGESSDTGGGTRPSDTGGGTRLSDTGGGTSLTRGAELEAATEKLLAVVADCPAVARRERCRRALMESGAGDGARSEQVGSKEVGLLFAPG
jgi:hypothetical protein